MRVKKQKRHRRVVRFYTACFGFRQPFKVLCDGTFVHHLLVNQITPADEALANILGAPVKLFTTKCVLAELKRLGSDFAQSLDAAQKLGLARCEHEKAKKADACVADVIGEKNSEHFFVGTQDVELRKKLQEVPVVPLIYGLRKALLLEQPSMFQREFAKRSEEERLHMTQSEYKMLRKRTRKLSATANDDDANNDDDDDDDDVLKGLSHEKETTDEQNTNQGVRKRNATQRGLGLKDRVQFKRKRAKGPNPLSCKKKKSDSSSNPVPAKESKDGDSKGRSRSRSRKRSHKAKTETGV